MRIFWDTNLFVYLWEGSVRTGRVEALINWQRQHEAEVVTSTLTIGELLVHPLRQNREDVADRYVASFSQLHVVRSTSLLHMRLRNSARDTRGSLRRMQFSWRALR